MIFIGRKTSNAYKGYLRLLKRIKNNEFPQYDFSISEYINNDTKMVVVCHEHGKFLTNTRHFKKGYGCTRCKKINTFIFINRANKKHSNKYTYDSTVYSSIKDKVVITCPIHGNFEQEANAHVNKGHGCPKCANINKYSKTELVILYFIKITNTEGRTLYKVGITKETINIRYRAELKRGYSINTILESKRIQREYAYNSEQRILDIFSEAKYEGPEFLYRGGGDSELFTYNILNRINL